MTASTSSGALSWTRNSPPLAAVARDDHAAGPHGERASGASEAPAPRQLALFAGAEGRREHEPPSDAAAVVSAVASSVPDDRQLDLFADRVVLARALDAAVASGRFEEAARIRRSIEETFGPEAARDLVAVDRLAGVAWDGPPTTPLTVWAALDEELARQPSLRNRVRAGVFARLLQSHAAGELLAARPDCLPALAYAVRSTTGRSPEEGGREARGLVRDALLAGHTVDALDHREDEALADLLAEDLPPRWLACLGRIRRLWPSSPPRDSEWEDLREVARGGAAEDEPALAFWQCLRLAESPDCTEPVRHEARRRMKHLHPELHAAFMRHAAHTGPPSRSR